MSRPRALITGASAGIGREFARVFAAHGYDLILVARRQDQLESLRDELESSGADIVPMARDLALKTAPKALHQEVRKRGLAVDVLVNNAGVTFGGAFTSMDADAVQSMVLLNAANLAMLTRLFVADMIGRGNGRILNVASLLAFHAIPGLTVYAATKAFVLSFTEGLAEELRGTGVTATALCPGLTDTQMVRTASVGGQFPEVPDFMISDVASVARQGYEACVRGEVVCVPGLANQLSAWWMQLQPRALVRSVGGFFGRQFLSR